MKSQLSVEWITIMASVLIIVIIAVISIKPLTPIPNQVSRRVSDQYWGDAPIRIRAFGNETTLDLIVQNNMKFEIQITNINLSEKEYIVTEKNLSIGEQHMFSEEFNHSAFIPISVKIAYVDKSLNTSEIFESKVDLFVTVES
jgi:hypothetical protein